MKESMVNCLMKKMAKMMVSIFVCCVSIELQVLCSCRYVLVYYLQVDLFIPVLTILMCFLLLILYFYCAEGYEFEEASNGQTNNDAAMEVDSAQFEDADSDIDN